MSTAKKLTIKICTSNRLCIYFILVIPKTNGSMIFALNYLRLIDWLVFNVNFSSISAINYLSIVFVVNKGYYYYDKFFGWNTNDSKIWPRYRLLISLILHESLKFVVIIYKITAKVNQLFNEDICLIKKLI